MKLNQYIVSHAIYTGSELVINGKITFNSKGIILSVGSTDLKHAESARTRFYSGMVFPGFAQENSKYVSLLDIHKQKLSPDDYSLISVGRLTFSQIVEIIGALQQKFDLTGSQFLSFWNKMTVLPALDQGYEYLIEPEKKLPLINIQGVDINSLSFNNQSFMKPILF